MIVADVLALLGDPETLMRRCYLHIAGGGGAAPANGQAARATFKVEIGDKTAYGFTTGVSGFFGRTKDRPYVKITKQIGPAQAVVPADSFNAYYVPMVQTADVANNTSHYTLPVVAGEMMITSRLSGCTFGVGSNAGAVLVSHIQPNANAQSGSAALSGFVQTGMNNVVGEFRKNSEYADYAAIIGRCNATGWRFYMQASGAGKNSRYAVTSVSQI